MEYYSAIRKDEIPPFMTTSMDLESIRLSKISQTEKNKNHMYSFTHMRDTKQKATNKQNKTKKNPSRHRQQYGG